MGRFSFEVQDMLVHGRFPLLTCLDDNVMPRTRSASSDAFVTIYDSARLGFERCGLRPPAGPPTIRR